MSPCGYHKKVPHIGNTTASIFQKLLNYFMKRFHCSAALTWSSLMIMVSLRDDTITSSRTSVQLILLLLALEFFLFISSYHRICEMAACSNNPRIHRPHVESPLVLITQCHSGCIQNQMKKGVGDNF